MESNAYVDTLITHGMQVFTFDFSGSGQSEGNYVSLGVYES